MPADLFGATEPQGQTMKFRPFTAQSVLAAEFSMLGLGDALNLVNDANSQGGSDSYYYHHQTQSMTNEGHGYGYSEVIQPGTVGLTPETSMYGSSTIGMTDDFPIFIPKKSPNMTECVPVPSSEHVAEIVGRQGMITQSLKFI